MCTGQMARADSFCRVRPAPFLLKMRCASEPSHSLSQGSVPLPQTEPSGGQGRCPSPDRALRRAGEAAVPWTEPLGGRGKHPSPGQRRAPPPPSLCPARAQVLGCPLAPVHYRTHCVYNVYFLLTFGVSHTQGERQPRAHPALPESTPNPLYLPHTPSLNISGPDARQQWTAPKPQICSNYWNGQVSSCVPCLALPLPHRPSGPGLPLVPWWVHCGAFTCPQSPSQDQAPEPPPPAPKSSLRPPCSPATLQAACKGRLPPGPCRPCPYRASPPPTAWPGCGSGCSCVPPSTGRP